MSDIPLLPQVEAFLGRDHRLFIDSGYAQSHSSQTLEVINPATGNIIKPSEFTPLTLLRIADRLTPG